MIYFRLMKSAINPFDSQEAKPYKNDPEILAMTNLVAAYQNDDISQFEAIIRTNRENIMQDAFIREHIEGRRVGDRDEIHVDCVMYSFICLTICWSCRMVALMFLYHFVTPNICKDYISASADCGVDCNTSMYIYLLVQ